MSARGSVGGIATETMMPNRPIGLVQQRVPPWSRVGNVSAGFFVALGVRRRGQIAMPTMHATALVQRCRWCQDRQRFAV